MKLLTLHTTLFFCMTLVSFGQITYEKSYPSQVLSIINLSASGQKYLLFDQQEIKLYNLDHSIYKTINIPEIDSSISSTMVKYAKNNHTDQFCVSEHIFDLDDEIEFLYKSITTYGWAKFILFNEDGEILWERDSIFGSVLIYDTDNGLKMIVKNTLLSSGVYYPASRTEVFGLPGILMKSLSEEIEFANNSAYPNPASNQITIDFTLPNNDVSGEIKLFDVNGIFISSYDIDDTFGNLIINISDFTSGNYYYTLTSASGSSTSKFIVIN